MSIILDGVTGITTPGLTNSGNETTTGIVVLGSSTTSNVVVAATTTSTSTTTGALVVKGGAGIGGNLNLSGNLVLTIPYNPVTWISKSANYTATSGEGIFANTVSSAWTLTLPESPKIGDRVAIADVASSFATNNLTVGRNGANIMGLSENMTVSNNNLAFSLIYSDATNGWRII